MSTPIVIKNSKGIVFFTLEHRPGQGLLYADWVGFVNEIEPAKEACLAIVELLKTTRCPFVLNDNRKQTGPWPPIDEWLGQVWLPALKKAGLEYLAHLDSQNVFTQLSAKNNLVATVDGMTIRHFSSETTALAALAERKAGSRA